MTAEPTWSIHGLRARLSIARLAGTIELSRPGLGLTDIELDRQPLSDLSWLGLELTPDAPTATEIDAYVRGNDLIVTYAETRSRPLRAQIYWRVLSASDRGVIAAIELVASVQTSLLDACPRLIAQSTFAEGDVLPLKAMSPGESGDVLDGNATCGDLVRPRGASFSCAELAEAGVARENRVETVAGKTRLVHELFADRLEKGVILRTRVRGVMLARRDDLAGAAAQMADFAAAALPLTT